MHVLYGLGFGGESLEEFLSYTELKNPFMMCFENWSATLYIWQSNMDRGTRYYTSHDLPKILELMLIYANDADNCVCDSKCYKDYFLQIANTGLFHDAVGRITDCHDDFIEVSTEY